MRVEWIEDPAGFDELAEPWEQLAESSGHPFVRHAWLRAWWDAFGDGDLAVATVWQDDRLVAGLPLERRRGALHALANAQSPVFGPVGEDAAVGAAIDAALRRSSSLVLPALMADRALPARVRRHARRARRLAVVQAVQRQPIVRLRPDWDAYRASLDRSWRKDVERRRRRLAAELDPTYLVVEAPDDLTGALERGFRAEAAGWKGEQGTSILGDARVLGFYIDLAERFAAQGRLRLSAVVVGDDYAAFDYALLDHGRLWILKGGFDERFRRFAPGLVLTFAQIERGFELGLEAVELLGESVPWKLRLANDSRDVCFAAAYAPAPRPLVRYATRRGWPYVRRAYRRVRPPR